MSASGPPAGWREDVVTMLFDFLEDAGLAHALRALETETGCARANAPRGRVRPLRARTMPRRVPAARAVS